MSNDPNEDLIEATIRRIQAQNAGTPESSSAEADDTQDGEDAIEATIRRVQAQSRGFESRPPAVESVEDTPEEEYASASMSRIEETIRRVRAQAATQAASEAANPMSTPIVEDPIEATIRRVQAQAAAQSNPSNDEPVLDASNSDVDEDAIAATIQRVQLQAQAPSAPAIDIAPAVDADEEDGIAAAIRRVAEAKAKRKEDEFDDDEPVAALPRPDAVEQAILAAERNGELERTAFAPAASANPDEDARIATPPEPTRWPGRDERMLGEPETWEIAAQRLEQGLQDTRHEVRQLAARLDALMPAIEQLVETAASASQHGAPSLTIVAPHKQAPRTDDDWDDSPKVSAMQFGTPPRPVYRDPSPQTATAAELVEVPAFELERPAASAPRLRAIDADGNLSSHLPRQYRITVEDNRRGVDLVPLHRAIQGLSSVKDMSLLSYSNGVAIVALENIGALEPELLREAVERAMSREAKIEVHNEQTMVVKIQEE